MSQVTEECFTCSKTGACSKTSMQAIVSGFVCPLFTYVPEPVVFARGRMMSQYGLVAAARALLNRPTEPDEERIEMSLDLPPPGTPYSLRKKQLEVMSFQDVRNLGVMKYKGPDHQPILDANATLHVDKRVESIEKVLQFELANHLIVPDAASQQPTQGVAPMAQQMPFQPPMMPPQGVPQPPNFQPQQMPMPPMPGGQPGQVPQMVMPQAPFGLPPQPPQGMPQQMMAPPPPPPVASPQQAAQAGQEAPQQAAPTGGKKKRGSAAAPPPPPPPAPQQQPQQMAPPQFQQPQQPAWTPPGVPQQAAPAQMPQQFQMPQPGFQQPPQQVPAPQGLSVDLSPVLGQIDLVGKAVNALGAADDNAQKQLLAVLGEIRSLIYVQVAALHHLYAIGQPGLAPTIAGKDVADVSKFIAYMQQYIPR